MQKMMRMIFALFIILPVILSLSEESSQDLQNLQNSRFFQFINKVEKKLEEFKFKSEEEKDKILDELDSSLSDLNKKIKDVNSEKKENPNENIQILIEKGIELSKLMQFKFCQKGNADYQNCVNNKKKWINNLVDVIEDNYGQCSIAIEHVTSLTNYSDVNLGYTMNLFRFTAENHEYMEKSNVKKISNIIKCLSEQIDNYWSKIGDLIGNKEWTIILGVGFLKSLISTHFKLYEENDNNEIEAHIQKNYRGNDVLSDSLKQYINEELTNHLKKMNESKGDKTMVIIVFCVGTITILIAGFILYRYIRRRKNSITKLTENPKDIVL